MTGWLYIILENLIISSYRESNENFSPFVIILLHYIERNFVQGKVSLITLKTIHTIKFAYRNKIFEHYLSYLLELEHLWI